MFGPGNLTLQAIYIRIKLILNLNFKYGTLDCGKFEVPKKVNNFLLNFKAKVCVA